MVKEDSGEDFRRGTEVGSDGKRGEECRAEKEGRGDVKYLGNWEGIDMWCEYLPDVGLREGDVIHIEVIDWTDERLYNK